jgi:hypothetical protein
MEVWREYLMWFENRDEITSVIQNKKNKKKNLFL